MRPEASSRSAGSGVPSLMADIVDIGTDPRRGGYTRPVHSSAETQLREWFLGEAARRGLDTTTDRNGVMWAWWDVPGARRQDAVVTGSHLDSVPGGGAFDGPLGVASALAAIDDMRGRGVAPGRPIAVAVFPEEEGSRFGVACLGSRLMSGAIDPDHVRGLKDAEGRTFAEVSSAQGIDPRHIGRDEEAIGRIGTFVELHVEQGRGLIDLGQPVALGSSILGHGRWRFTVTGQGNHAGTTLMQDRSDPMVAASQIVVDIRRAARGITDARATVGRLRPIPGGTNVIASEVEFWMDARHPDDAVTAELVASIIAGARRTAAAEGCRVVVQEESLSPTVQFDVALTRDLAGVLPGAPVLDTGAGHDAGVLAAAVPTAMLFVRNPTGISHSPEEHVEDSDADLGAQALADVLTHLTTASASDAASGPLGHSPHRVSCSASSMMC